jgi:predicted enzyme related to lactoylglutathione lyase
MVSRITQWTLDVHDVDLMARFWSQALGYRIDAGEDGSAKLYPPDDAGPDVLAIWLQHTSHPKRDKNRNHPDLNTDGDVDAEAERLVALGARRVDIGQTDADPFVVLADPEGNEFCVLRNHPRKG